MRKIVTFLTEFLRSDDLQPLAWLLTRPLFWAVLGIVLGPYLFLRGFRALHLKRHIMNTPLSSIRSAAMGLVEISGRAVGPYSVVAPLSKEDCLYYRLMVAEDPDGKLSKKPAQMCAPLFVEDETGMVMVDPFDAEIRLPVSHQKGSFSQAMSGYRSGQTPEFIEEFLIKTGETIFVLGTLQENHWAKMPTSELSRIGPGFVSQDEADLQRREAFPFLDPSLPSSAAPDPKREFDLSPPIILTKGNGPFLISFDSERELLSKLGWKSLLFIWGAPIWTLWAVWEILSRLELWKLIEAGR
jgi:hypothetical protein